MVRGEQGEKINGKRKEGGEECWQALRALECTVLMSGSRVWYLPSPYRLPGAGLIKLPNIFLYQANKHLFSVLLFYSGVNQRFCATEEER